MSRIERCNGQSAFGNACGTPANAPAFAARLAGLPRTPQHLPRDLRDSRKRPSICRETCGSTRKRPSICRKTCGSTRERQGKRRETYGSARKRQKDFRSTSRSIVGIFKTLWPWRGFRRNSLQALFLHRTHVILYLNDRVYRGSITRNTAIGGAPHRSMSICVAIRYDIRRIYLAFNKVKLRYGFLAPAELAEGAVTARFFLVGLYEGNARVKEFVKHMAHGDLEVG